MKELQPIFDDSRKGKADPISIENILSKIVSYWPLFIVSLAISLIVAYVYLRYATPVYLIQSKVYVRDNTKGGMAEGQVFQDLGISSGSGTVDNEIEILKSRVLMKRVVEELDLNIHYLSKGHIKTSELYKHGPFIVKPLYNKDSIKTSYGYQINMHGNNFLLVDGAKTISGKLGDTIALSAGPVIIEKNLNAKPELDEDGEYMFAIGPVKPLAKQYAAALIIEQVNMQVSIIRISINDIVPQRGEDIINKLVDVYTKANINDRNRVVDGTIEFIDDRLVEVKRDLTGVEKDIEAFRSANSLTHMSEQSKALFENTNSNTQQITRNAVQLKIVESLSTYLQNNKNNNRVVPSAFFINDITLTSLINNYNLLQGQKEALQLTNTDNSPYIKNMDVRISNARTDILNSLASIKRGLQVSIDELNKSNSFYRDKIKQVPATERIFLEYSRQQNIIEQLYLFLLKRREETAISKSATIANARIIEPALAEDVPVSPNGTKIFLMAVVIGLLLPGGWVFGKELLNVRVSSKQDVTRLTTMSVMGEIGHNYKEEALAIKGDSRSQISEQFRLLRTNLQFLLTNEHDKSILITSSMSGEGKSFIAINLASSLALLNKKVVLLELDLRKPKISSQLGIENTVGFSTYAIGKAGIADIIKPSGIFDNLYVIPSGAIPPNPAELITLPRTKELFDTLKKEFDYLVLDTAPIGLVADAQLINKYGDITLYVLRQGYTYKQQLLSANDLHLSGKMKRMSIVMNDVKMDRSARYAYGYGNYTNGYFEERENKNGIKRRIKRLTRKSSIN